MVLEVKFSITNLILVIALLLNHKGMIHMKFILE